ncbi:helix-turn-helix domain-containing protein [Acetobacterium woodii]|uniref:Transcriptional regulator XRE family n=1 Tax=Acetobacterium woodii (strain ATCC 29683 / DSM 1030 / JCM 2381 / KCTC 1655 / WB1) TaxID=931626 RepID=H6LIX2_ACEWD|nr:helix-turn-helix domain-containing protein [Acetobacterium woodii]AFA49861.1 transcriptional regulator XRE family [Acetobacterium woodii DSM 1030]
MIGSRLKYLRNQKNLNQTELANALCLGGKTTISSYENGYSSPDNETLSKIADYFHVSTDYLLGRTDNPLPVRDVDQDLHDEQDVESQWRAFVKKYSNDRLMFLNYEDADDEQKLLIMEEYLEALEKKKKRVEKFMDYPLEVIDEALNFAAYNVEQRKKKNNV